MKTKTYYFCRTVQCLSWMGLFYKKKKFNIQQTIYELNFNTCQLVDLPESRDETGIHMVLITARESSSHWTSDT